MIKVLFLCVGNAARSQMAEGFARFLADDKIEAFSAGSKPAGLVDTLAIQTMKEKNIDISSHQSKGFDKIPASEFDYVVGMDCGDTCPVVHTKQYIQWDIPDPNGKTIKEFRKVRDEIEQKIDDFIQLVVNNNIIKERK